MGWTYTKAIQKKSSANSHTNDSSSTNSSIQKALTFASSSTSVPAASNKEEESKCQAIRLNPNPGRPVWRPQAYRMISSPEIKPKLDDVANYVLKRLVDDERFDPLRKKLRASQKNEEAVEDLALGSVQDTSLEIPTKSKYTNIPITDMNFKLRYVVKGCPEATAMPNTPETIWRCDFEPVDNYSNDNNTFVAISGLQSVLFLDTEKGHYVRKYDHKEINEIFYTAAWTTISATPLNEADHGAFNVLAVAGYLGSIKLLNVKKNECYRCIFGHRRSITALAFSKKQPTWLFSASDDKTVRLWDIGTLDFEIDDSLCLAKFNLPGNAGDPTSLSVSYDLSMIVVGTNKGDMIKFQITDRLLESFHSKVEKYRENISTKIGVSIIQPSCLYPSGDEWHEGYIDGIYILGQDGIKENPMNNKIVSRGLEDMEIIVWDTYKSTEKDASIDIALEWPDANDLNGLNFKIIESPGQKALIAGDYDGQIHIFSIGDGKKSRTLNDQSKEQFQPDKVLSHKLSTKPLRDICCSNDTRTIVAIDYEHTVFVWVATS